jgi:Xaa-Pro aminopeptidase
MEQNKKLSALRAEMAQQKIDGFFVPRADEFQGEYVPASAERLAWISGFTGSAGQAVILNDKAAFFTDGRYTIQARDEVKTLDFYSISTDQSPTPTMTPVEWIEKNFPKGAVFGIDPWIHTLNGVKAIQEAVEKAGGTLKYVERNPLDAVWDDRPAAPKTPCVPQLLEFAGQSSADKRVALAEVLKTNHCQALVVALPEEICWLLNVRGNDVPCTPFTLSYAIAHADKSVDWFVDAHKLSVETKAWVGDTVRIHALDALPDALATFAEKGFPLWLDPASAPVITQKIIHDAEGAIYTARSPIQMMKAKKNAVEIQGTIDAHIRDGAALTRFIAAVSAPNAGDKYTEISASDMLEGFRAEGKNFRGLSFDTISGSGAHGAIVHYRSSPESDQPLSSGPIYLVDSGAQYLDGTTDVTRTIAVGAVTPEMKEHVTRVLKGHIQVAMAVFPEGTTGDKLDEKARSALKEVGLDYAHGTGHGVGSYLSVHEGPCGIHPRANTVPLEVGMVISNEPGFYKEGAYGIRIESLVTVIDTGVKNTEGKKMLGFKTLTMAPIDKNLIEPSIMTNEEIKWFNDYHADVRKNLLPLLESRDPAAAKFLIEATEPLKKPAPPIHKIKGFLF